MNPVNKFPDIICIGASLIDLSFQLKAPPLLNTSNPSTIHRSAGGVVRNIAHNLALLGTSVELISVFGKDPDGKWLEEHCSKAGIGLNYIHWSEEATGVYAAVVAPSGELFIGTAASHADRLLNKEFLSGHADLLSKTKMVLADCNLSTDSIRWLMRHCEQCGVPLVIETVSIAKAARLNDALPGKVFLIKPTTEELDVFGKESDAFYATEEKIPYLHSLGVQHVWLTKGSEGSVFSDGKKISRIPAFKTKIENTNGAGDAAIAGWIWAWLNGHDPLASVQYGHAAAAAILNSESSTRDDFSPALLKQFLP